MFELDEKLLSKSSNSVTLTNKQTNDYIKAFKE